MKVGLQFGLYRDEGGRDERVIMKYYHTYLKRSGVDVDVLEDDSTRPDRYELHHPPLRPDAPKPAVSDSMMAIDSSGLSFFR